MPQSNKSTELVEYYKSQSTIQLVENYLNGGHTELALSILEAEFQQRRINPTDLNEEYLNDLLIQSGYYEGATALSSLNPIVKMFNKLIRFKQFATDHPYLFSLIIIAINVTFGSVFLVAIYWRLNREPNENNWIAICLWNVTILVYIVIIWRFKWFKSCGLLSLGKRKVWIILMTFLAYEIALRHLFGNVNYYCIEPYYDNFDWFISGYILPLIGTLLLAFDEELIYRGLILYCFLRLWGNSKVGMLKSVIISSIIFGLMHALYIVVINPDITFTLISDINVLFLISKVIKTTIGGFILGALFVYGKTIWIPVIYHTLGNFLSNFYIIDDLTEMIVTTTIIEIPILLCGIYLVLKTPTREVVPEMA